MRNECNIIRDILPLYSEEMVSKDTKDFVREHLIGCPECRAELESIKIPVNTACGTNDAPLRRLKRKLLLKKLQTVLCTLLLVSAFLTAAFAWLTAPQYFRYTRDFAAMSENADGTLTVTFDDRITGYSLYQTKAETDSGDKYIEYNIEAWTTTWDHLFQKRGPQNVVIKKGDMPIKVYYIQNDSLNRSGTEDVLLYGNIEKDRGGRVTMPRLTLFYWFALSGIAAAVLGITLLLFRKRQQVRRWLETILLLPVSYMMGYACVCGAGSHTYSAQRDFFLIILITIPVYCALLLGRNIYRMKKELRGIEP